VWIKPLAGVRVPNIVVIDAHEVVHAGIQAWLRDDQELNQAAARHYTTAQLFLQNRPGHVNASEVVLLGLDTGGHKPDFAALRELSSRGHRVVVYSRHADRDVIRTAIDSGALTYLVKSEGREHLLKAVRAATTGEPYVGPSMAAALDSRDVCIRPVLAPREQQVLLAWFQTDSKDLVAQRLFLAPSTVRTHLQRIRAKYSAVGRPAGTKAALVARAIQDGIISVDDL
jgi:DNA-binding NarL/FixJ family response regulator